MTTHARSRRTIQALAVSFVVAAVVIAGAGVARAAAPTISSFDPTSGPVGTAVVINGDHFSGPDPDVTTVSFNGVSATFTIDNPHRITATVPAGATTGPISVASPDGTAVSATNFTVTVTPLPTITSFNPVSGPVGTLVTIVGTNLSGATAVSFSGIAATTFSVNPAGTQITATVPAGATTGPISVTTPGGTANSSTNFTVTPAGSPTITSFEPTSGPVGTSVTIVGTNLTGATSVSFNGVAATTFTVNPQGTRIIATVPAGATTGPITVTNPSGTGTSATPFTVTVGPTSHERTVTLELRRHLVARGVVQVADGFDDCAIEVRVNIQRLRSGTWRTIDSDQTNDDGIYREPITDRRGRYRAVAVREELNAGADVCRRDRSPARRHQH